MESGSSDLLKHSDGSLSSSVEDDGMLYIIYSYSATLIVYLILSGIRFLLHFEKCSFALDDRQNLKLILQFNVGECRIYFIFDINHKILVIRSTISILTRFS